MELRVLQYFLMVAREENITRAAGLLHLTQPTLSRQLMQLEEELGVKLFHRSRHRITLTDEGMLLRRRAEEMVALSEKTKEELRQSREQLTGKISIGSGELQSSRFLAGQVARFRKEHPLVRFEFYSGHADHIKERIEHGLLDLGLLSEPVDLSRYDFLRSPVREEWGVLVREDSPLARLESVRAQDLVSVPLILPQREMVQQQLGNWFGSYAEQIQPAASGNLQYNQAILAQQGIGCVLTLRLDSSFPGLRFVPLSPRLESGAVLVWKKLQVFAAPVASFLGQIREYLSGMERD